MASKKTLFLKQGDGRTVKQPDGSPWPAEGMDVLPDRFIRRRIADLDLVEAKRPVAAKPAGDGEKK